MTDLSRLRALALACDYTPWWEPASLEALEEGQRLLPTADRAFIAALSPQTVLRLLDRLEALQEAADLLRRQHESHCAGCSEIGVADDCETYRALARVQSLETT